jgi:DNA-binding SARP family transcriptional activator
MYAFHTFGSVYLADDSGPLSGPATQRRRLALLALLASAPAGGLSRDKLIAFLWPELSDEAGRSRLADALHGLRRALGREAIISAGDDVRLNTAIVRTDLGEFERALAAADHERVAALYRGPFLDGFHVADAPEFERWVEEERQRLARGYARALEALAEAREAAGDTRAAVEWWRRLAVHDPYSSRVTMRLMQALSASGDAAAAMRHAQVHRALLREELGVEPDGGIAAFAEQLKRVRTDAGRGAEPAPVHARPETLDTSPLDVISATAAAHAAAPQIGIQPADEARRVWRRRLRYGALTLAGAAVLLGVAAVARWEADRRAVPALDPETLLIAPFRVAADPSLDYLGEGLVDLLATSLNGEADSRAVDARTTLAAWQRTAGRANADLPVARAAALARTLGAGQLLMGSVSGTPEHLTLNATLYGAARTAIRMRVSSRGPADSLPALVDRLVGQILAREAGVPRHQLETLTTTSLPALRAYLEGVRSYRHGSFGRAVELFDEALREDSTFALAAIQLALAAGWGQLTGEPGTAERAARLAWAARDRLSLPDRLLLEAFPGPRFPEPSPPHELYAARVRALNASPDRPEAVFLMGAYHLGGILRGEEDALARSSFFFRRALELDSAYAAPLSNLVREAALAGDTATVQRLTQRYLAADSTSEVAHLL